MWVCSWAIGAALATTIGALAEDSVPSARPLWAAAKSEVVSASPRAPCFDLARDCGAQGAPDVDDTPAFERCQRKLAEAGGGCVDVGPGRYEMVSVELNVSHSWWSFGTGVTIVPHRAHDWVNDQPSAFFVVTAAAGAASTLTNVTISGVTADPFLISNAVPLACPWNVRGVQFAAVTDFALANIRVALGNNHTNPSLPCPGTKPAISFTQDREGHDVSFGVIENVTSTGGWPGYGLSQIQTGRHLHFERLDGTGGITLRMETGGDDGFVDQVTGNNITCRDGSSALMAGPHAQVNGVFHATNLFSYGCRKTVSAGAGWAQKGKPAGSWSNASTVAGVFAYFGHNATLKCHDGGGGGKQGKWHWDVPSCEACTLGTPADGMHYNITVTNIHTYGFPAPTDRTLCDAPGPTSGNCTCDY